MDDEAEVRLVDAHAERVGGDDGLELAGHEPILDVVTRACRRGARDTSRPTMPSASSSRADVVGSASPSRRRRCRCLRCSRSSSISRRCLAMSRGGVVDAVVQVLAIDAEVDGRRLAHAEHAHDVGEHAFGGRRRQREDRRRAERPALRRRARGTPGGSRGPTPTRSAPRRRRTDRSASSATSSRNAGSSSRSGVANTNSISPARDRLERGGRPPPAAIVELTCRAATPSSFSLSH